MFYRPKLTILILALVGYYLFYTYFTGSIQYLPTPSYGIKSVKIVYVFFSSETYSGPGLEIVGNGFLIMVRIYPLLLGFLLSFLFGLNIAYLWQIYRAGMLRSCLLAGSGSGAAAIVASLVSAGYLCCSWTPSLLLLGGSLIASLGMLPSLIAAALLTLNAYILSRRIENAERVLQKIRL